MPPLQVAPALGAWSNFYVMTGTSAASLTGLMFVVITLVTRTEPSQRTEDGLATFSTPTVLHFCAALLISAILCAPWRDLAPVAALLAIIGMCGVLYLSRIMVRTKRLTQYTPDLSDWLWYNIVPFASYGAILLGGVILLLSRQAALFALAAGVVLLIFVGIRNAWDVVTFLAVGGLGRRDNDAS